MLTGREHRTPGDDRWAGHARRGGPAPADYEATGHVSRTTPSRPADDPAPAYKARLMRRRAVAVLSRVGWTVPDISLAVGLHERHVYRLRAGNSEIARAAGRV